MTTHTDSTQATEFDLDRWLDDIEPTQRMQTVNTRGDLLASYGRLQEQRRAAIDQLERLAQSLPDGGEDDDAGATLGDSGDDAAREIFEQQKAVIEDLTEQANAIAAEYASHRARVTFAAPDKSTRARIVSESKLADHKTGTANAASTEDTMLKLMRAAVVEIVVVTAGREIAQDLDKWTVARWARFLDRIGDGQSRLLADAYLGLASGALADTVAAGHSL
ncbi:hypothetical protein [Rathayibacter soli]|uniref:hypothetical protein n=1 Tax=Rathayibacter soli TaxID=3144168 RepID=UPI0027E564F8|nr:hypothetical protein [Glaciibacter superstes]